jgi:hypothetical protein
LGNWLSLGVMGELDGLLGLSWAHLKLFILGILQRGPGG